MPTRSSNSTAEPGVTPRAAAKGNGQQSSRPNAVSAPDAGTNGNSATAALLTLRAECEELRRRFAIVPKATQNAAIQISELEKALLSIRQARDTTLAQVHSLTNRLEVAEGRIDELVHEQERIQKSADLSQAALEATESECLELRGLLRTKDENHADAITELEKRLKATQGRPTNSAEEKRLSDQLAAARTKITSLETYFQQVQQQQKQTNSTLIEKAIKADRERRAAESAAEAAKRELQEHTSQGERLRKEITEMQAQMANLHAEIARLGDGRDQAGQLELQRQQIEELSAQLDTARDEVRLAWAVTMGIREPHAETADQAHDLADDSIPKPLEPEEARALLTRMTRAVAAAATTSDPQEILETLRGDLKEFAQRSLCAGSVVTYRTIGMCTEVVEWLQKNPNKVGVMQPALAETFDLLSHVAGRFEANVHADTEGASVYVVDDDLDNCECIAMALDKLGLRTHYASKPELGVDHLRAHPSDLVVLDVDLGTMNGFEVHAKLRQVPHHRATPVLFVSALTSAQDEVVGLGSQQNDFLGKPYTLYGIGLKALCMIVAARLRA
jgi:CheY-like chemotaxis protein